MSVVQAPVAYKERNGSIPRRKACTACAKARRRCDLFLPTCSRCSQRGLNCEYPLLAAANLPVNQLVTLHLPPSFLKPYEYEVGEKLLSTPVRLAPWSSAAMARMQVTLDVFQNAHRTMVLDNETPWSHPLLYRNFMPRSMQGACSNLPLLLTDTEGKALFLQCIVTVNTYPDAYACCSLYMNRNATNFKNILSIIENRVADLLASEQPTSAIECLARLQALIIYQTIRLFDDDTSARLAAAMTMPALRSSLTYFLQNVYVDDTLAFGNPPISSLLEEPSSSSAADHGLSRDFWQTWIFEESARRTIFLAYLLIRIWEVMYIFSNNNDKAEQEKKQQMRKNHKCDGRLGSSHCWYLSSHLWQARTRYEFALAYAEKNRFLIRDLDFTEFLAFGYPDDVDMFGKMVLSASMGIEAFQNWCSARGGM